MSDETGNGVFVLHSVSGCYAEVHISRENYLVGRLCIGSLLQQVIIQLYNAVAEG